MINPIGYHANEPILLGSVITHKSLIIPKHERFGAYSEVWTLIPTNSSINYQDFLWLIASLKRQNLTTNFSKTDFNHKYIRKVFASALNEKRLHIVPPFKCVGKIETWTLYRSCSATNPLLIPITKLKVKKTANLSISGFLECGGKIETRTLRRR